VIVHTRGFVVRRMPFQDTSLIVSLYTAAAGMKDFIVKGARSTRGRSKQGFFQALAYLDIVYYERATRDLQPLTEYSCAEPLSTLHTHPVKMVYAMLLAEVLHRAVREQEANPELFAFVEEHLLRLEAQTDHLFEQCAHFMLHLTRYLGFYPMVEDAGSGNWYFALEQGRIERLPHTADPLGASIYALAACATADIQSLHIPAPQRKPLLQALVRYYSYHMEHFIPPQSLAVFEAVFRD